MSEFNNLYEIVEKLNGPIGATGRSEEDRIRLENLKSLIELTRECVRNIADVSTNIYSHEHSVREIGREATKGLENITEESRNEI